jgi:PHS family inorganic phosphate transporter-like MFS transporter
MPDGVCLADSAECQIFPTEYRCTFYGIAAAAGKLGSIVAQGIVKSVQPTPDQINGGANSAQIRWALLAFAICMVLGAVLSQTCIPHVQRRGNADETPWVNKTLEELAKGRESPPADEEKPEQQNVQTKQDTPDPDISDT